MQYTPVTWNSVTLSEASSRSLYLVSINFFCCHSDYSGGNVYKLLEITHFHCSEALPGGPFFNGCFYRFKIFSYHFGNVGLRVPNRNLDYLVYLTFTLNVETVLWLIVLGRQMPSTVIPIHSLESYTFTT
jgi:hypothetical protein